MKPRVTAYPATNTGEASETVPDAVIDAAIAWAVKLQFNQPTPRQQQDFLAWLASDACHRRAWQRLGMARQPFDDIPASLVRPTLDSADRKRHQRNRRHIIKVLGFAGILAGSGWIVRTRAPWQRMLADASTKTGEVRTMTLQDGTRLTLNTDSAIGIMMQGEYRIIVLLRGEVLISTGPDLGKTHKRPFWVHTPQGRIQALGTRFTVRLADQRSRISVQEGAVALHPTDNRAITVVHSGEDRWMTGAGTQPANLHGIEADSWADGVIAGTNMRLADLLGELARYRIGRIICDDRVADLRVSGLYHTRDTNQTLLFLAQTQPIRVSYRTRYLVFVSPLNPP